MEESTITPILHSDWLISYFRYIGLHVECIFEQKKNQRFVNINGKMISLMDCSGWEGNFGHNTPIFL